MAGSISSPRAVRVTAKPLILHAHILMGENKSPKKEEKLRAGTPWGGDTGGQMAHGLSKGQGRRMGMKYPMA